MRYHAIIGAFALIAGYGASSALADTASVVRAAEAFDVVILGEVHDNPNHHATQAELLDRLAPRAVVFEMLSPEEAGGLTPEVAASPEVLRQYLDWDNSGWPDLTFNAPLFQYASTRAAFGAEVPRDEARLAFQNGAAAVFGSDAARFGLTSALPEDEQTAREAEQLAAHCDVLPVEILPGFVAAQRLRDAHLARAVLQALATSGAPVVVITGNGHARTDWGIPAVLAVAAPEVRVFSLGQVEGERPDTAPFDAVLAAPAPARDDPCAAFQ